MVLQADPPPHCFNVPWIWNKKRILMWESVFKLLYIYKRKYCISDDDKQLQLQRKSHAQVAYCHLITNPCGYSMSVRKCEFTKYPVIVLPWLWWFPLQKEQSSRVCFLYFKHYLYLEAVAPAKFYLTFDKSTTWPYRALLCHCQSTSKTDKGVILVFW